MGKDNELIASHDKEEVLKTEGLTTPEEEFLEIKLYFRKPSYRDDMDIISDTVTQTVDYTGQSMSINPALVRYSRLNQLLIDWDLTDDEGKKVKVELENLDKLDPALANAILEAMDQKVLKT